MRKIVAYELLSLDGIAEQPNEFFTEFDEVMRQNLGRVIATQDAVILGRRTYDEWAPFWPTSDVEPFASFINGVRKYVVTSTPPDSTWLNTTEVSDDLSEFAIDLKREPGRDIGLHGSIAVTQSLLEEGLVDELRLVIAPALHMHGRRLFDRGLSRRLTLTRHAVSPSGYQMLDLQVDG